MARGWRLRSVVGAAAVVAAIAVATPASAATSWTVDRNDPGSSGASWKFLSSTLTGSAETWAATGSGGKDLVMRKRGSTWQRVTTPAGMSGRNAWFTGLAAVAPDNVWLQARTENVTGYQYFHYNGSGWTKISSSGSGNGRFTGVSASSSTLWAAASLTKVARYTNGRWTQMTVPGATYITGIAAWARDDVWVVGGDSEGKALAAHYDGSRWTRTSFPSASCGLEVNDVTTVSRNNAYAYCLRTSDSPWKVTAMHWNGTAWSILGTPYRGNHYTVDMAASKGGDVYVTADQGVLRLHDGSWTYEDPSAGAGLPLVYVDDVAVWPGTETAYAVGNQAREVDEQIVESDYLVWKRLL